MKPHVSIAISRSHSSRGFSMKSRSTVQPAQFTSTSTAPNETRANSTADETESQSVTSTCRAMIDPAGASASTLLACSRSTSAIKTRAPSPAKPRLIARPRLDAPPVTITTRPFNPRSIQCPPKRSVDLELVPPQDRDPRSSRLPAVDLDLWAADHEVGVDAGVVQSRLSIRERVDAKGKAVSVGDMARRVLIEQRVVEREPELAHLR